jgi:peptidoglycan/xylan/chitin deacetylase (PgdA/CDA1 family)
VTSSTLTPLRIRGASGRLAWSEGLTISLPDHLWRNLGADRVQPLEDFQLPSTLPPLAAEEAENLRDRAAYTDQPPVSSRLPVTYQSVPPWLRSLLAGAVGRWQRSRSDRWARFPRWPLDVSADFLADWASASPASAPAKTPVLLSHDIDSLEGLRNVVQKFLPLEESLGAKSSSYFVPQAWPLDHGLLGEIAARGHELGIHGHDHANKTPFLIEEEMTRRLEVTRPLIERYGIKGYRAPSLLRTRALLRCLAGLYAYDSSIPTSGGLYPVPNNGCATARPYLIGALPELPLSLPRDGSLRFLGYSPKQIVELWITCAEQIARSGGVVVLLTHCEQRFSGNRPMLEAYRHFLEYVAADSRYAWDLPVPVLQKRGLRAPEPVVP